MNYTIDTGTNLTGLGILFLFLKYLLPVVIGLVIIVAVGFFIWWVYRQIQNNFEGLNLNDRGTQVAVIVAIMIAIAFLTIITRV